MFRWYIVQRRMFGSEILPGVVTTVITEEEMIHRTEEAQDISSSTTF